MNTTSHTKAKVFLLDTLPLHLEKLHAGALPSFGLMSPQHMLEHLVKLTKTSVKSYGEAPAEPSAEHLQYRKFIMSEAPFPQNNKEDGKLDALYFKDLEEAKQQLLEAVARFYKAFEENPDLEPYNPVFGKMDLELLESLHYKHFVHHFRQFNLL